MDIRHLFALADPVLDFETGYAAKLRVIVGDERKVFVKRMRGNEQIHLADP